MPSFHTSAFVAFALGALPALAALGSDVSLQSIPSTVKTDGYGGGYWYAEVEKSSHQTCTDTAALKDAVKLGWDTAQTKATHAKKLQAPVAAALCVPGHGIVVATSIKGAGHNTQSGQTCAVIDIDHKNYGNCAEPNVVAIALNEFKLNAIPAGSKLAVYGAPGNRSPGWLKPCSLNEDPYYGCTQWLQHDEPNVAVITRDLSYESLQDVATFFVWKKDTPPSVEYSQEEQ